MTRVTIERTPGYLIVKMPLKAIAVGRTELSLRAKIIVDRAITEGLHDIAAERVIGPFTNVRDFKESFKRRAARSRYL